MITVQEIYNLTEQNTELPDRYVVREKIFNKLIQFLDTDLIKVITGIRRSGKTFLLKLIYKYLIEEKKVPKENILFLNFEAPALYEYLNVVDLQHLYEIFLANTNPKYKVYLFLDEIQNVKAWEKFVRYLYDTQKEHVQIFVTGSNSRLLSSEYSTAISGRVCDLTIYPFSFKEVLNLIGKENLSLRQREFYLNQYLKWGGLPEVWLQSVESIKISYISLLIDKIITDDIVNRYNVKNPQILSKIALYIFNNIGGVFNLTKISNFLKSQNYNLSRPKIEEYIQYLSNAYLISTISNITTKSTKEIIFGRLKKSFTLDNAFISTTTLNPDSAVPKLVENLTFNLLQQMVTDLSFKIHFAYDTSEKIDTDLAIKDMFGKIIIPINITTRLEKTETFKREIYGLSRAINYLNAKKGLLFTWDYFYKKISLPSNIEVFNLKDILLNNTIDLTFLN